MTETEMQTEMRQTLRDGYLCASLKSVDAAEILSRCVDSGELGSEKGFFLQSRYISEESELSLSAS